MRPLENNTVNINKDCTQMHDDTRPLIDLLIAATVPSDRQTIGGVIFKNLNGGLNWISPSVIDVEIFIQSVVNLSNLKLNAKNYSMSLS